MKNDNHSYDEFSPSGEINVTPMIDVMLVLLLIFMVVAPISTVNVPVELPSASAKASPTQQKMITVTLRNDQSVYIMDKKITGDMLADALHQAGATPETTIYLRIDKNVNYGQSLELLDALRMANFSKVALVGLGDKN